MSDTPDNITISGGPPASPAMDYNFLRELARETLERLGTSQWTDFNDHDPGITILDFLCYAMTDVGYRANFSIADILADETGIKRQPIENQFYTARQILHTSPVTENDYRRLLIDIEGVRNAWVIPDKTYPDVRGVYRIQLDVERDIEGAAAGIKLPVNTRDSLLKEVHNALTQHRNLCEDFLLGEHITLLEPYCLGIEAELSIESNGNAESIVAELLFNVEEFISTHVHFYSLRELTDSGEITLDKIFDGPELSHGFIPESGLRQLVRDIDTEKIIPRIRSIRFVDSIHTLGFFNAVPVAPTAGEEEALEEKQEAEQRKHKGISPRFKLPNNVSPFLSADKEHCRITVLRNGQEFKYSQDEVSHKLNLMRARQQHQRHAKRQWDLPVPQGRNRNISRHQSVQYDFPTNYGIGPYGLPSRASTERKAQSKQLKAFLLLFDQILANSLSQIANLQNLLSWDPEVKQTYFPRAVERIPPVSTQLDDEQWLHRMRRGAFQDGRERNFLKELLADVLQGDTLNETALKYNNALRELAETRDTAQIRRDKALRHLMARFAEEFAEYYQFVMSQEMDDATEDLIVRNRVNFLRHYPEISKRRGTAQDVSKPEDFEKNYSGFKKRVAMLLGFEPEALQGDVGSFNSRFRLTKVAADTPDAAADAPSTHDWKLVTEDGSPLDLTRVLQHAGNPAKYAVVKEGDGRYVIALFDAAIHLKGKVIFVTQNTFPDLHTASVARNELVSLLTRYQSTSENFHLVEHILLRPDPSEKVFTFSLVDIGGGSHPAVFTPSRAYTLAERTDFLRQVMRKSAQWLPTIKGRDDFHQLEIRFEGHDTMLTSTYGFETNAAAMACFKRLQEANTHRPSEGLRYQIVSDYSLFSETGLMDPYSFMLSVVLPDWPTRFRASGFRKVVEHTLRDEVPAHVFLNILWLDKTRMQEFEELFGKWTHARQQGHDATALAHGLMAFLQQEQLQQIFQVG